MKFAGILVIGLGLLIIYWTLTAGPDSDTSSALPEPGPVESRGRVDPSPHG